MKIHDALMLELIKPNNLGEPTGFITTLAENRSIKYELEEETYWQGHYERVMGTYIQMAPDIVVTRWKPTPEQQKEGRTFLAVELETDVDFDFGASLRQVKKYRKKYPEVHIIIPREYADFAPLYKNEGIMVWLWQGLRKWECLLCGNVITREGPVIPKCESPECNSRNHRLTGLEKASFERFPI